MKDQFLREIDYMRISITDRCNLRCRYCMPDGVELMAMKDLLTYEEICEVAEAAAALGIRKLKVTGGEPLVRRGCPDLIRKLKRISGIQQVTLTTNGVLLEGCLPELLDAGLDAVNISIDTLDEKRYREITGRNELSAVKKGLQAAWESGLKTKVNAVLQKGVNDAEWEALCLLAKDRPIDVRFIEMMPIGYGKSNDGVSNEELFERLRIRYPKLQKDLSVHGNGPAVYVHIPGWAGGVGFISAMHGKFCGACNRVRLTAQGKIKPCLCFEETEDLMPLLRGPHSKEEVQAVLRKAIFAKPKQHCFEEPEQVTEHARMISIGG